MIATARSSGSLCSFPSCAITPSPPTRQERIYLSAELVDLLLFETHNGHQQIRILQLLLLTTLQIIHFPILSFNRMMKYHIQGIVIFIKAIITLQFEMLERFTESFSQLKKSISLKYIDVVLRQRCSETLELISETMPQAEICRTYINKIEEVHEAFLQSISGFIDSFPHYVSEYQQQFESIQHELLSVNKNYEEEKREWQNMLQDMNEKIERIHKEIINKEEDVRELHLKIEERDAIIDHMEKQSNEYLKKVEGDLYKQQKALEESYFVVQRLEQEVETLKFQNERLLQSKSPIHVIQAYSPGPVNSHIDNDEMVINGSYSSASRSQTFVKCSIGSHASHEGLSQFEQIQQNEDSREILDSMDFNGQLLPKCETLKEMLNMSVEKEYKLQYNKCDSIENKISKENFKPLDLRDENSKENNEGWGVNTSLQFISKDNKLTTIKQFNIHAQVRASDSKQNNPYYFYFLIASQNAKINSQHFEDICSLSTLSQWEVLNNSKTPLHEWQRHLQAFLLRQAKII